LVCHDRFVMIDGFINSSNFRIEFSDLKLVYETLNHDKSSMKIKFVVSMLSCNMTAVITVCKHHPSIRLTNRHTTASFHFKTMMASNSDTSANNVNNTINNNNIDSKTSSSNDDQDNSQIIVCLCMIVKNESKIIERCLDSTRSLVDCIAICDTGSTDNTVALIQEWQARNKMPGDVYCNAAFCDFGYNRTLSLKNARITLSKLGYPANSSRTYVLLLDADMILTPCLDKYSALFCHEKFTGNSEPTTASATLTTSTTTTTATAIAKKGKENSSITSAARFRGKSTKVFQKPAIMLRVSDGTVQYRSVRFLRLDVEWQCWMKTHEFYAPIQQKGQSDDAMPQEQTDFPYYFIDDRADGGCKADKFERDERLLRQHLEEEPMGSQLYCRAQFYLAQTLKDLGAVNKAAAENLVQAFSEQRKALQQIDVRFERAQLDLAQTLKRAEESKIEEQNGNKRSGHPGVSVRSIKAQNRRNPALNQGNDDFGLISSLAHKQANATELQLQEERARCVVEIGRIQSEMDRYYNQAKECWREAIGWYSWRAEVELDSTTDIDSAAEEVWYCFYMIAQLKHNLYSREMEELLYDQECVRQRVVPRYFASNATNKNLSETQVAGITSIADTTVTTNNNNSSENSKVGRDNNNKKKAKRKKQQQISASKNNGNAQEAVESQYELPAEPIETPWCRVLEAYLEAYKYRPQRLEPLYHLAEHYRIYTKDMQMCNLYALPGSVQSCPTTERLFLDKSIYDWRLLQEMAIAGYYGKAAAFRKAGFDACDRLCLRSLAPDAVRAQALNNLWYYIQPLQGISIHPNPFTAVFEQYIQEEVKSNTLKHVPAKPELTKWLQGCSWVLKNASIVNVQYPHSSYDHYRILISAVNYRITEGGGYVSSGKFVYSRNFLVDVYCDYDEDAKFYVSEWKELQDATGREIRSLQIQGFEDGRLIPHAAYDDLVYFTASLNDSNSTSTPEIVLATVNKSTGQIVRVMPLRKEDSASVQSPDNSSHPKRPEKNWLPVLVPTNTTHGLHGVHADNKAEKANHYADGTITNITSNTTHTNSNSEECTLEILYDFATLLKVPTKLSGNANFLIVDHNSNYKEQLQCPISQRISALLLNNISFAEFRLSAGPVPFPVGADSTDSNSSAQGYLYLIHQVIMLGGRRKYMHRFVQTDRCFEPIAYTRAFYFRNKEQIEYVAGMCLTRDHKALMLTLSVEDCASFLVRLPCTQLKNLLLPLSDVYGYDHS
jgi:hypothetical protein